MLNETKAFSLFKKASAQNNADGQFFTGLCYRDEVGVQQSLTKAAILFEKAAKQGLPRAQNALGECYEHGEGVEQDYFQAVKWYKKAAKLFLSCAEADSDSCFMAGECYEYGRGVTKNLCKAIEYYTVAVKHGHEEAKEALTRLASLRQYFASRKLLIVFLFCTDYP